jgi:hypothetical protein
LNIPKLQAEIVAIYQEIAELKISAAETILKKLLNIIERLIGNQQAQEIELQELRDEINRLKGEQGKPDIKPNKKTDGNISSETERKEAEENANKDINAATNTNATDPEAEIKKKRQRDKKLPKIKIDREQICPLNKDGLPDDLIFKGYQDVIIQNIIITTDNVKYRREVFYSPSQHKSYQGELPTAVQGKGEYGCGIRALIPILKSEANMSEKRILGFFENFGIVISPTYISRQWTHGYDLFHQEKSDLYRSGLIASDYANIDDTKARFNGVNHYCQIVCNQFFTAYFTTPKKDRLSVLAVLTDFAPTQYIYSSHAQALLNTFNLSNKACIAVDAQLPADVVLNEAQFNTHLAEINTLGIRQRTQVTEACAIAYYQQQIDFPVVKTLLSDDAPQFKLLTLYLALCWVHDGRHYKKLNPILPIYQEILHDFLGQYWKYYGELLKYQKKPTAEKKLWLSEEFKRIFTTVTNYDDLNERIAKTLAKRLELLRVLELPHLPLHNNAAELGARVQARSRDVSFQTRSERGTKIKDTFMSINQTAIKLGVSFYDYVYDRVSGQFKLPSLADLITQTAQGLRV